MLSNKAVLKYFKENNVHQASLIVLMVGHVHF
jgi:hypothetical protein